MQKFFGKNWRTTLLGYLGAVFLAGGEMLATGGTITAATLGKAVFVALAGKAMKDAGVTGTER